MKQKSHSGLKKRLKIRKSGSMRFDKSSRRHLLTNKSKKQKRRFKGGLPADSTKMKAIVGMLPGKIK